jgi:hypothetical protein
MIIGCNLYLFFILFLFCSPSIALAKEGFSPALVLEKYLFFCLFLLVLSLFVDVFLLYCYTAILT